MTDKTELWSFQREALRALQRKGPVQLTSSGRLSQSRPEIQFLRPSGHGKSTDMDFAQFETRMMARIAEQVDVPFRSYTDEAIETMGAYNELLSILARETMKKLASQIVKEALQVTVKPRLPTTLSMEDFKEAQALVKRPQSSVGCLLSNQPQPVSPEETKNDISNSPFRRSDFRRNLGHEVSLQGRPWRSDRQDRGGFVVPDC